MLAVVASTDEIYVEHRPLVFGLAYRRLGSVPEAEDVVQEAFLRFHRVSNEEAIESPRAWLASVATRLSIDQLRSARVRREQPVGQSPPEALLVDPAPGVPEQAELADALSLAFLAVLESLSPAERAVFLLRELRGYGYGEIAETVDRSEESCRQLAVRARRRLEERRRAG